MLDESLSVSPSAERDPDGAKLQAALTAQLACERAQQARSRRAQVLAALGLPLWILCVWPDCLSAEWRRLVLTAWAFGAIALGWALAAEWRQRCKRDLTVLQLRGGRRPHA